LSEAIGIEKVQEVYDRAGPQAIDLVDIHFLTIEEIETLCASIKESKTTLVESLEKAKLADSVPATAKFDFMQHLSEWGIASCIPQYLKDRSIEEIDKFKKLLQPES
jgi:hypothetical protein